MPNNRYEHLAETPNDKTSFSAILYMPNSASLYDIFLM